jgi:hypothetical protein
VSGEPSGLWIISVRCDIGRSTWLAGNPSTGYSRRPFCAANRDDGAWCVGHGIFARHLSGYVSTVRAQPPCAQMHTVHEYTACGAGRNEGTTPTRHGNTRHFNDQLLDIIGRAMLDRLGFIACCSCACHGRWPLTVTPPDKGNGSRQVSRSLFLAHRHR